MVLLVQSASTQLPVVVAEVAFVLRSAVVTLVAVEVVIAVGVVAACHRKRGYQAAQLWLPAVWAGRVG